MQKKVFLPTYLPYIFSDCYNLVHVEVVSVDMK